VSKQGVPGGTAEQLDYTAESTELSVTLHHVTHDVTLSENTDELV